MPLTYNRRSALAAALFVLGCGGGVDAGTGPTGESTAMLVFSASPLRLSDITEIIPIGNLAPPGHTLPTEHAYFFFYKDYTPGAAKPHLPVFAPAAGTIRRVQTMSPANYRIDVDVNAQYSYYLILINMDTQKYKAGTVLTAGEQIGVTEGGANTLDIGVINRKLNRTGFARAARYGGDTKHIDSPFKYFSEPLRSEIYARVNREGSDKDGTIEVDVNGTLAGVWFRDDVPVTAQGAEAWSRAIAFAPDVRRPVQKRISIGEGAGITGLFGTQTGSPEYSSVTAATGRVGYRLDAMDNSSNPWRGVLMVQLKGVDTLMVQYFPGSNNLNETFTSAQLKYLR